MTGVAAMGVETALLHALRFSRTATRPYRRWYLPDVLPEAVCRAVAGLPYPPPEGGYVAGKREEHNDARVFFSPDVRAEHAVCEDIAAAFQSREVVGALEDTTGAALAGNYLRIEYCQDTDGFWLGPHTDISVKRLTLQIYLSTGEGAESLGTDVCDAEGSVVETVPATYNTGFMFVPGPDTWHAFHRRPIPGVRRTLIVNYVTPEWRARHELSFPEAPAGV